MAYADDISGKRFGKLVAVRREGNRGPHAAWLFQCDCGGSITTAANYVKRGSTRSCGCFRADARIASGKLSRKRIPEYGVWIGIKARCYCQSERGYASYGGRGIYVAAEWLNDFDRFYADVGPRPKGMTLERNDNDGPYAPWNCRWATPAEQARNKRSNVFVEHDGQRITLKDYAVRKGVHYFSLHKRIGRTGEAPEVAAARMLARRG